MKTFDPKITPGPWGFDESECFFIFDKHKEPVHFCYESDGVSPEDLKAILAIPEMLEVVRAIRNFLVKGLTVKSLKEAGIIINPELLLLEEALKTLDEKHGTEAE